MALFGGKKKGGDDGRASPERPGGSGTAAPSNSEAARSPQRETTESARSESLISATRQKLGGASQSTGKPVKSRGADALASKGDAVATIGKSIIIKGELTGDEDIVIDGTIEGDVKLPSHQLTIGAHGKVTAEVNAKSIQVTGHVKGNVTASERVEVEASGTVEGDISAPRLLIQEGAVVNGAIRMTKGEGAKPEAKPQHGSKEPARKAG